MEVELGEDPPTTEEEPREEEELREKKSRRRRRREESSKRQPKSGKSSHRTPSDEDERLRHVQNVLELNDDSRERMRLEGITRLEHLYDIEHLLRENQVKGLTSVETTKLLQFLSWISFFRAKTRGTLPDIVADFSVDEYNRYVERERSAVHTHVWPFLGLWEIKDDVTRKRDSVLLDALDEEQVGQLEVTSQGPPGNARLRETFLLAEEAHRDFHDGSGRRTDLKEAMNKYRVVVGETAESVEDCMIQAFACVKLGVLLTRAEFRNQRESVELMKKAAVQFKMPAGMFFYGVPLVFGLGGVVKDVPRGIAMLSDAGAAGIGEAYFVLGNIYEGGADGIRSDLSVAKDNYESTIYALLAEERNSSMRAVFEGMTSLFQPKNMKMPALDLDVGGRWKSEVSAIKGMMISEGWQNAEGVFISVVGERFNWGLAGQAFLVGAAVVLTQTNQANHYPALLPLVPLLGMMLAAFSFIQTLEVVWRNSTKRRPVRDMHAAKLKAFGEILQVGQWHRVFFPPFHYFLLFYYQTARICLRCCSCIVRTKHHYGFNKRSEDLQANIVFVSTWGYTIMIAFVTWLIEIMVLLVALSFFVTWLILLATENQSRKAGCSDWWYNTCQGSQVRCNEEETIREECPLYADAVTNFN